MIKSRYGNLMFFFSQDLRSLHYAFQVVVHNFVYGVHGLAQKRWEIHVPVLRWRIRTYSL